MLDQAAQPTTQIIQPVSDNSGAVVTFPKCSIHGSGLSNESEAMAVVPVKPSNKPSPDMNLKTCKRLAEAQFKLQSYFLEQRPQYCV